MNRITRRSAAGLLMAALLPAVAAAQTGGDDQLLTPAGRRALLRGPRRFKSGHRVWTIPSATASR